MIEHNGMYQNYTVEGELKLKGDEMINNDNNLSWYFN